MAERLVHMSKIHILHLQRWNCHHWKYVYSVYSTRTTCTFSTIYFEMTSIMQSLYPSFKRELNSIWSCTFHDEPNIFIFERGKRRRFLSIVWANIMNKIHRTHWIEFKKETRKKFRFLPFLNCVIINRFSLFWLKKHPFYCFKTE